MRHVSARSKGVPPAMDGVGSVERHSKFARRKGSFFYLSTRIFSLSFLAARARFVNRAVESCSTNQLDVHEVEGPSYLILQ